MQFLTIRSDPIATTTTTTTSNINAGGVGSPTTAAMVCSAEEGQLPPPVDKEIDDASRQSFITASN